MSLFRSYNTDIESAYIITLKGNETSEKFSDRCQQSCKDVQMPHKIWEAFDGTQSDDIKIPDSLKDHSFMNMLKLTDHYMTKSEVACALSHISLWAHCAEIDRPIVILEHDAIMVKAIKIHASYNSIVYLGGIEWAEENWPMAPIPPHASDGPNLRFICRAHAYSIDPTMAHNLLSHVLKMGIMSPLDVMLRADLFHITHQGLFAYDKVQDRNQTTTITGRPQEGRIPDRNDDLKK